MASAAGKLYVFGGLGDPSCTNFCRTFEAYDPRANIWTAMGDMPYALAGLPSATTGPDGLIYLFGLPSGGYGSPTERAVLLVYDPRAQTWSHAPPPPGIDESPVLVTGLDGRIYSVGGTVNGTAVGALSAYDPSTHAWTTLAPDPTPQHEFAATVGPDGRIYVIGGDATSAKGKVDAYNPQRNAWTPVAALPTPRFALQLVTGPDGRIYALGGEGRCFTAPCDEVEAYDIHTKTWTAVAPMPHGRWQFVAAVGPDGCIYVLGGFTTPNGVQQGSPLPTEVDAYTVVPADQPLPKPPPEPTLATRRLASMPTGRYFLGAATSGGKIYAIGGQAGVPGPNAPTVLRTVEAYDPKTNTWAKEPPLPAPRVGMGVATGPDGRIYVLGGVASVWGQVDASGYSNTAGLRTVFIYNPRTRHWTMGKPMPDGRYGLAAVTGKDGRIYTIGGATYCHGDDLVAARIMSQARPARRPLQTLGGCWTRTVRAFNPQTNSWTTLAPLHVGRFLPTAAVGLDGLVYVFGGDSIPRPSFEAYDPGSNRWTKIAGLAHVRSAGFAAAARGGRIDLIGGCLVTDVTQTGFGIYCGDPSPVDTYDPRTSSWQTIGVTLNARQGLAATTGPDGRVYAIGGGPMPGPQGPGDGKVLEVIRPDRQGERAGP
ncbi:MAG TPA: kelch repeat-containing protein [Chloroflexota bacterium]